MHQLKKIYSFLSGQFNDLFIPVKFRESDVLLRKARVLAYIHTFLFSITIYFFYSNLFGQVTGPSLEYAFVIIVGLILIFRYCQNFNLSGNLLAFFLFLIQAEAVYETGGLYSDNLLWILASPLLALLFANPISGMFWLFALIGFSFHLYFLEIGSDISFRQQTEVFDAMYFLTTYVGLFIIIVGIVLIFATGQRLIIQALNEKQNVLTAQKAELSQQAGSLKKAHNQLKTINEELEQFAYAASHDLKEPLRMIKMYTQFIEKRLNDQLDQDSKEYIHFVVDGVVRMERLLTDLLEYSRLGRSNRKAADTNLNDVLLAVINNLTATMQETNTSIMTNELPVLQSTSTEMIQLFQNLISNSIKFRQQNINPLIEIGHEIEDGNHHFIFKDNGIGIPRESCDRVFNIFERLHSKAEYEGTGIGLATCKKIIDNLGGKIWVEPREDARGTTFQIVIPKEFKNQS